jgi:hypothetical protein
MSIAAEERALKKLPPQKYTIRILVAAVIALSSTVVFMWRYNTVVQSEQQVKLETCMAQKAKIVEDHAQKDKEEDRREIEELKANARYQDSVQNVLNQALIEAHKAKRNAKK